MGTSTTDCLVFLHIMKTGGTTLARLLENNVAPEHYFFLRDAQSVDEVATIPEETRRSLRVLRAGHIPFGAHRHLPQKSTYITMLRHPVDRVLSLYYFIYFPPNRESPQEFVPLKTWLETSSVVDNNQTHKLAGIMYKERQGGSTRALLDSAKQHFQDHFSVVGITERFDESVLLMHHRVGLKNILYQNKNVNQNRPKRAVDPEIVAMIEERNQFDLELYQYANDQLDAQIAQIPTFEPELALFQQLNAQFTAVADASDEKTEILKQVRQRVGTLRESRDEFKRRFSDLQQAYRQLSKLQVLYEKSKLAQVGRLLKITPFWKKP
ncbi:MAG: sulfotransferase family 2 domain-containing protein [Elainellaceae cyanobacterium]